MGKVLRPTTYEDREPHYADLKNLIVNGFLSHRIRLGDSILVVRNLTSTDNFYLQNVAYDLNDVGWMLWTVSRSVWMIDGMTLLGEKNSAFHVYQQIKGIPKAVLERIFFSILKLTHKANKQYEKVEAYSYEESSRLLWQQSRGFGIPSDKLSGIIGSENLGMNLAQKLWISFNSFEDRRALERSQWANAKFIASAQVPKAIEKINKREEQAVEQEVNRRKKFLDLFFYKQIGIISEDDGMTLLSSKLVKSASTPEELEEEMRQWVSGEHDEHDKIVLAYKMKIKEKEEKVLREREDRLAQVRAEMVRDEESDVEILPLIGYTREQLREHLSSRGGFTQEGRKITKIQDESASDHLYSKHVVEDNVSSGRLKVRDGKILIKGTDNTLMADLSKRDLRGGVEDGE